jgi:hypothetical protein
MQNRRACFIHVVARLAPGLTLTQAQTKLSLIATRLAKEYPPTDASVYASRNTSRRPQQDSRSGWIRYFLCTSAILRSASLSSSSFTELTSFVIASISAFCESTLPRSTALPRFFSVERNANMGPIVDQ